MKILLLTLALTGPARADEPALSPCAPAAAPAELRGANEDVFRATVKLCLDDLRRSAAKKGAVGAKVLPFTFHAVSAAELPAACPVGDLAGIKRAIRNQLESCSKFPPARLGETRNFACKAFTRQEWCLDVNRKMLALADGSGSFGEYLAKAKKEFDWVKSDGWPDGKMQGQAQFTAYHGPPPIEASAVPTAEYNYPVYRKPADLVSVADPLHCGTDDVTGAARHVCQRAPDRALRPFPDRDAIDNHGALRGRGLEIAWVKDPVAVAFLMVEGSGSVNIHQPDGSALHERLNFDAVNGRTLNMLGRVLLCLGARPEDYGSLTGIKKYLAAHPANLRQILAFDQSYVFFKTGTAGPFGADEIPVTARHTFATDRRVIPTGAVMLFQTQNLAPARDGCEQISSLGLSQDSGGAIVGPHVDWYLGEGQAAQDQADAVNQGGSLFIALPKGSGRLIPGCGSQALAR